MEIEINNSQHHCSTFTEQHNGQGLASLPGNPARQTQNTNVVVADEQQIPTAAHNVPGQTQPLQQAYGLRRKQCLNGRAVRVTITNYSHHYTVFALWTNANCVLRRKASSLAQALFLACTDGSYQHVVDLQPLDAGGLAKLALLHGTGSVRHHIRLNQRFRAATGHCFYPGMSLAQVMCAVQINRVISQMCYGHDWDETAVDPVVDSVALEPAHLRVMAFHTKNICAVYGKARLVVESGMNSQITLSLCDSQYNVKQPAQLVTSEHFLRQAGYGTIAKFFKHTKESFVFLTQALKLPSGCILYPGTSLQQVMEELSRLKGQERCLPAVPGLEVSGLQGRSMERIAINNPDEGSSLTVAPHVPSQPSTEAVGVGRRRHNVSRAVRVTVTNYDTCQTVYALWTNAEDVLQAPPSTEALFLTCTDETYQFTSCMMPMDATSLAMMASLVPSAGTATPMIQLNQRFRAAGGQCFYAGMSVAQVMRVLLLGKDTSKLILGQDWDETAIDPVVDCSVNEQACVHVMVIHTISVGAAYGKAQVSAVPGRNGPVMISVCDSYYNDKRPRQLLKVRQFFEQAGYAQGKSRDNQCMYVFLTQGLKLPSGYTLMPGTSLHQVLAAKQKIKLCHETHLVTQRIATRKRNLAPADEQPLLPSLGYAAHTVSVDSNVGKRTKAARAAVNTEPLSAAACSMQQQHPVSGMPTMQGNKVPPSLPELDQEAKQPTRQTVDREKPSKEQTGLDSQQHGIATQAATTTTTEKEQTRAACHPLIPLFDKAHHAAVGANLGTGSPSSAPTTVIVQPAGPVPNHKLQNPTASTSVLQHAQKPPPTLPELDIQGNSIHPLCVVKTFGAICSLLRFLNCSNDAVKQMWSTRQQWRQEGEGKMHHFAMSYAELASAVQCTDWEYVKQVLRDKFQLPV